MTKVTKPKPNKKPPRLYRVALVSDQAVRHHIKNLSGDAWIDTKAD